MKTRLGMAALAALYLVGCSPTTTHNKPDAGSPTTGGTTHGTNGAVNGASSSGASGASSGAGTTGGASSGAGTTGSGASTTGSHGSTTHGSTTSGPTSSGPSSSGSTTSGPTSSGPTSGSTTSGPTTAGPSSSSGSGTTGTTSTTATTGTTGGGHTAICGPCTAHSDCASGYCNLPVNGGAGYCDSTMACNSDAQCAPVTTCDTNSGSCVCPPVTTSSSSSGTTGTSAGTTTTGGSSGGTTGGGFCSGPTGFTPNNGDVGADCSLADGGTANTLCASGEQCLALAPGVGFCTKSCTTSADCGGSLCDPNNGICLPLCKVGQACPQPSLFACNPFTPNTNDPGLCLPGCASSADCNAPDAGSSWVCSSGVCKCTTDADCGGGYKCDQPSGSCYEACPGGSACNSGCCVQLGSTDYCDSFVSATTSGSSSGTTGASTTASSSASSSSASSSSGSGTTTGGSGTTTSGSSTGGTTGGLQAICGPCTVGTDCQSGFCNTFDAATGFCDSASGCDQAPSECSPLACDTNFPQDCACPQLSGSSSSTGTSSSTASSSASSSSSSSSSGTTTGGSSSGGTTTGGTTGGGTLPTLIFTEYVEGSSNNKALEITNRTGASVDLKDFQIRTFFNGSVASTNLGLGLADGGSNPLADHTSFVVCRSASSGVTIPAASCNLSTANTAMSFNGNDALELFQVSTSTVVDSFGQVGNDPGAGGWTGASGTVTTTDHTLRRKCTVTAGDTVPNGAFDPSTEWDVFAIDTFGDLGTWSCP